MCGVFFFVCVCLTLKGVDTEYRFLWIVIAEIFNLECYALGVSRDLHCRHSSNTIRHITAKVN